MKGLRVLFILLFVVPLLIVSCSIEQDSDNPEEVVSPNTSGEVAKSAHSISGINPNRSYYDVVVVDIDRWEICLKVSRVRYNVTSYWGHLWYQMGSFVFEGNAAAVYDHTRDLLTVTALDSGWDRGHICYSLQFEENSNDMSGAFVYREYPRRANRITAWLAQGTLGTHTVGNLSKSNEVIIPSKVHAKKELFENEN